MLKVLIVEDEKKIRDIYKTFLTKEHFQVYEAENGAAAAAVLDREADIALILLDIRMPEVGGQKTFDLIKSKNSKAKVIVASVYPVDDQRRVISGADGFFDKSEGIDMLLTRMKRVLSSGVNVSGKLS